jgi:hypothetical protein
MKVKSRAEVTPTPYRDAADRQFAPRSAILRRHPLLVSLGWFIVAILVFNAVKLCAALPWWGIAALVIGLLAWCWAVNWRPRKTSLRERIYYAICMSLFF